MEGDCPPLFARDLTKFYGKIQALDHLSLELKPGEVFGLLGPNGAGKTTFINIISTLEEATSGTALVFGKKPKDAKNLIGIMPQELIHHGYFNVEEILTFHGRFYGLSNPKPQAEKLLKRMALWNHRKKLVNHLSGGMKRRLLIAKALIHEPKLLLLDEPTAGVDVELRASIWEFVKELREENVSILLTTHYLEEAEILCDRIGVINQGKLLQVDEKKNLVDKLSAKKLEVKLTSGEEKTLTVANSLPLGEALKENGIPLGEVADIHIREGNLEEAFTRILNENR